MKKQFAIDVINLIIEKNNGKLPLSNVEVNLNDKGSKIQNTTLKALLCDAFDLQSKGVIEKPKKNLIIIP